MPRGNPSKHTISTERYQKKNGYKVKGFKLRGDIADQFAEACERNGVSQASQITKLMQEYIDRTTEQK